MSQYTIEQLVAGALFDFAGFLTSMEKPATFSGRHDAAVAVELLSEWAAKRGLNLDEARVKDWSATLRQQAVRVDEVCPNDDSGHEWLQKHHVFVYEFDFGDEGKGRYVRLNDFNRVVSALEAALSAQPAAPQEDADLSEWLQKEIPPGTIISNPVWWAKRIAARMRTCHANNAATETADGKRQWDELASIIGANGDDVDDVLAKARALVKPAPERQGEVAEVYRVPEDWGRYEAHLAVRLVTGAQAKEGDKLYTHPAAPVCVPDPMIVPYGSESGEKDYAYGYEKGRADGWNACRRLALDAATPAPVGVPDGMVRLWDTQWMNIVNHDNCYRGWDKADAINHAVKMTEQAIARNIADGKLPPRLIAAAPSASVGMGLPDVKAMVDRFLGWRLPESFAPDCYISFNPEPLKQWPGMWPVGTNLLDADQAEQMVRYMLAAPSAPQVDA